MVALAGEIAEGAVWANAARSHMTESLRHLPDAKRNDPAFFIGDMVPTCIDPDRAAAAAVMRKALASYVKLPNYQNYWMEAGYTREDIATMSDRWLTDVTLFGSAKDVRDGVEAWRATGVRTVILVPSSTRGGQMVAFEELIAAFR
jgi:alkanesulfonate monooxygenase SsuD/methylene tetrahydromethanopterin reductase-like flavin-dependent oxidoreductase (luciferase family)